LTEVADRRHAWGAADWRRYWAAQRDAVVTTVIEECPSCEGAGYTCHYDGGYERQTGAPTGYTERCTLCDGKGWIEEEVRLMDQDDLDELDAEEVG
jgi:hypothetical protein